MGKKGRKMSIQDKEMQREIFEIYGLSVRQLFDKMTIKLLLNIGNRVCPTDYAVQFYYKKNHPKFYLNREALLKAIRRVWAIGAFEHRSQIMGKISEEFCKSNTTSEAWEFGSN